MAETNDPRITRLQELTGADANECARALESCEGDLGRATAMIVEAGMASSLRSQFLIAMPGLEDEHFGHTVSLVCEHNDKGAIGLVINKPLELSLTAMLEQMGIEHDALDNDPAVYWGGPVQPERGFVLHREPGGWDSCLNVVNDLYITTSRDVLAAIGRGQGPQEYLVALGYAGWGAGQLESEILLNSWLNAPADVSVLFETAPRHRWQAATRLIGVDVVQLSGFAGHA